MCQFTRACLPQNDNTHPPQPPDHSRISWHHRTESSNESDPAMVLSWSRVAMLPFNSTGIPCNPLVHSPCVVSLSLCQPCRPGPTHPGSPRALHAKEGEITSKRGRAIWFQQVPIVCGPSVYAAIFYTLADGSPIVVQRAAIFRSGLVCRWMVEIGLEREFLNVDLQ
ncbi:hypothetical protein AMTR_s00041p00206480 [Amborella trichopoda]|uniref:Uncharacterized protein n=1 Tax=Amborella trichopoda TaxID=13333 RepID=W1PZ84_AMBTC|nr:hypothetical protein AMTR_s00041p00206480 [Amborella trichopoda]